jgi:hypothetical protein
VGLPGAIGNHTFRATGIMAFRKNGGTVEHAQQLQTKPGRSRPGSMTAAATKSRSMRFTGP